MEKLCYAEVKVPIKRYERQAYTIDDIKRKLADKLTNKIIRDLAVSKEIETDKVIYKTKVRVDFCDTDYSSWENSSEGR